MIMQFGDWESQGAGHSRSWRPAGLRFHLQRLQSLSSSILATSVVALHYRHCSPWPFREGRSGGFYLLQEDFNNLITILQHHFTTSAPSWQAASLVVSQRVDETRHIVSVGPRDRIHWRQHFMSVGVRSLSSFDPSCADVMRKFVDLPASSTS